MCDAYAADFILSQVGKYAAQAGEPVDQVMSKRSIGTVLGMFIAVHLVPRKYWNGTAEHPPIRERLQQLINKIHLPEADNVWFFIASVLCARLQAENRMEGTFSFSAPKDLAEQLLARISRENESLT